MNARKVMIALCGAGILNLMMCGGAFAAAGTNKVYSSGILVLAFLGFCALVVVIQLIPAIMAVAGMVRAYLESRKENLAEAKARN